MSRSSNANRYGTLAERKMADRYDLRREGEHTSWCDAVDRQGNPWELKATMAERADGSSGRFRIFEDSHEKLQAVGGYYGFAVYKPRGRGITIIEMKSLDASELPGSTWYGAGGHRGSNQRKVGIEEVF